jgi:hypothetical protein
MILINADLAPVAVKILNSAGETSYVHISGKGRVELPKGWTPDSAWLNSNPKVTVKTPAKPTAKAITKEGNQK